MSAGQQELCGDVRRFVREMVELCGMSVEVSASEGAAGIEVGLSGSDSEMLLDNQARVLYALHDIVNQVFLRRGAERIEVDCGEFRAMRVLELELLAHKAADHARTSGRVFRFQPMPPGERRTIHLALAGEAGVRTESKGNGTGRHVVILPE